MWPTWCPNFTVGILGTNLAKARTEGRKKIVVAGLLAAVLGATASTVATAACLVFCTTGELIGNLRAGMTKDQVIAVLGNPDGYTQSGSTEALTYGNRLMSGFSWDRADYHVILTSGAVTAYGPGTVRQNSAPVRALVLIPLR
jgi:hypothetical protein